MDEFIKSSTFLFVLLNPFLMSIYLLDLIEELDGKTFARVLVRGTFISGIVFSVFALCGDFLFTDILQARFQSFLIFGGIIFLIIGIRFVFSGSDALRSLRGDPEHLAGSIAMPFMIGPGTLSASVLAGSRLDPIPAILAIVAALVPMVFLLVLFKSAHDRMKNHNETLVRRYTDVVGRIMALVIGTYAVEMIFQGVSGWLTAMPITPS